MEDTYILHSFENLFPNTNKKIIESIYLFCKKDQKETLDTLVTINNTDYTSIKEIENDILSKRKINYKKYISKKDKFKNFFKSFLKKNKYKIISNYKIEI